QREASQHRYCSNYTPIFDGAGASRMIRVIPRLLVTHFCDLLAMIALRLTCYVCAWSGAPTVKRLTSDPPCTVYDLARPSEQVPNSSAASACIWSVHQTR